MTESEILDAIAAVFIGVEGLNDEGIYSAGGGTVTGVKDLPENIADGPLPAVVVLDAGDAIIPGSWERTTSTIEASVWMADIHPRGEVYRQLLDLKGPIRQAFREKGRAGATDPALQAVVVTGIERVVGRQWVRGDNQPWFLVLPIELQVTVNRAVTYRPA